MNQCIRIKWLWDSLSLLYVVLAVWIAWGWRISIALLIPWGLGVICWMGEPQCSSIWFLFSHDLSSFGPPLSMRPLWTLLCSSFLLRVKDEAIKPLKSFLGKSQNVIFTSFCSLEQVIRSSYIQVVGKLTFSLVAVVSCVYRDWMIFVGDHFCR